MLPTSDTVLADSLGKWYLETNELADEQTLQNGIIFYSIHTQELHKQVLKSNHVSCKFTLFHLAPLVANLGRLWLHASH